MAEKKLKLYQNYLDVVDTTLEKNVPDGAKIRIAFGSFEWIGTVGQFRDYKRFEIRKMLEEQFKDR